VRFRSKEPQDAVAKSLQTVRDTIGGHSDGPILPFPAGVGSRQVTGFPTLVRPGKDAGPRPGSAPTVASGPPAILACPLAASAGFGQARAPRASVAFPGAVAGRMGGPPDGWDQQGWSGDSPIRENATLLANRHPNVYLGAQVVKPGIRRYQMPFSRRSWNWSFVTPPRCCQRSTEKPWRA
jgi:hypothetical protein